MGQTYDFTDRADTDLNSGFHNGASDYVGRIGYNNMKWFQMASRFRVAREDLALRHMETSARVWRGATYFNIGHMWSQRFIDEQTMDKDINEGTVGVGFKLSTRWSVQWNAIYNIDTGDYKSHSGGLFYNHPCYYMSVQYHRDNTKKDDYEGTTTFKFKFGMSIDGQRY